MEYKTWEVFLIIILISIIFIVEDFMINKKLSTLEQQVQALQKIDTSKLEQNKNFLQFCQKNKLIFVVGEGQQREIYQTNILCK